MEWKNNLCFKEKEALQDQFRQAINKHFDNLDINDNRKNMLKFRNKLDNMVQKPKSDYKIGQERERYINMSYVPLLMFNDWM